MRQGHACGYDASYNNDVNLQACSGDTDCTVPGFVCACPAHVTLTTPGGTTTCTTTGSCDPSQGRCVRGDCRNLVAGFHNNLCSGTSGSQLLACQNDLNACSIAGEECKTLACVDTTEGAVTDNRVTVIR